MVFIMADLVVLGNPIYSLHSLLELAITKSIVTDRRTVEEGSCQ